MLVEAYSEHALGKTQCFEWFNKFKSGNFDVRNEDRGKPSKKFEDWDQKDVIYYELLKPGETVNTNRYQQQTEKNGVSNFECQNLDMSVLYCR